MRVLLLGKNGQLGWEIERWLSAGHDTVALDFPEVDFTQIEDLAETVRAANPQVIINAVAYTNVDQAEAESTTARLINAEAVERIAQIARERSAVLIHYSTDYVFDGTKTSPYVETDPAKPINTYGRTKLQGERAIQNSGCAHWIIRTSWLYSTRRDNFVLKVLQWARKHEQICITADQISNPTWARTLSEATRAIVERAETGSIDWLAERSGIYHVAGGCFASRYDWALEIIRNDPHPEEQIVKTVLRAQTSDFHTPAQRPLFSALDCEKFESVTGYRLPHWKDELRRAMSEE